MARRHGLAAQRARLARVSEATWDAAYVNDLPDSSFAVIEAGGNKVDGKTEPRSLRHLPFKNMQGDVDLPHLRNALARLDQVQGLSDEEKATARKKLESAAKTHDVGDRASEGLSGDSLEGQADEVRAAWGEAMNGMSPDHECQGSYVTDVFPDSIVIRMEDGWARVPYTRGADGVTFGDPIPVAIQFVETGEAMEAIVRESIQLVGEPVGAEWHARILRFGPSANGWVWTRESADSLLPMLEGAPVCWYEGAEHAPIERLQIHDGPDPARIVGQIAAPHIDADGVYATVRIHEGASRAALLAAQKAGRQPGVSVDTLCSYVREGLRRVVTAVRKFISLDIVHSPSADGRLLRATAGPVSGTPTEDPMRELLIARIREARPALLEGKDVTTLTDEVLLGLVQEAMKSTMPPPPPPPSPPVDAEWRRELALRDTKARVSEALAASSLPDLARQRIRQAFEGQVAEIPEIQARITEETEFLAKLASGDVKGFGAGRVEITAAPLDKAQAGLDRLFGVEMATFNRAMESSPFLNPDTLTRVRESLKPSYDASKDPGLRFRSLRHAYVQITGDEAVEGRIVAGRASEAIESATWANILGNTLYRRLLMDYAEPVYNERTIATYGSAVDFRTKEVAILDYFPDISTVDPESADYTEITAPSDAKVSYAVAQKGNILTITRKTIINDDLRAVSQLVGRLGRSARRTLAKFIWQTFWVSNANYDVDSTAWFHTNHGNTGTTALSADAAGAAELLAKVVQLADMTEQGSSEKLGQPPLESLWLDVPHALLGVARRLNLTDRFSTTETNPVQYFFGQAGERINCNPLFTDTTDWGIHVSPGVAGRESIAVDFLQGREEPEFFLADMPTVGQMFIGDRLQYKLRHEYGGDIIDYRGACKNVVSGG